MKPTKKDNAIVAVVLDFMAQTYNNSVYEQLAGGFGQGGELPSGT